MNNSKKYAFSFTGASALISETLIIAEEFYRLKDWKAVEKSLVDQNLLSKIKQTTFKREFSEIKKRLSSLTDNQLQLLIEGSSDDTKAMILLSLIKVYSFLYDFIVEVIRNKYLLFDRTPAEVDYIKFVNSKKLSHSELDEITELTASKVKQVVFKLLEQVGLITQAKNGSILKPFLSNESIAVIIEDNPALLNVFLYSNEEIKALMKKEKYA